MRLAPLSSTRGPTPQMKASLHGVQPLGGEGDVQRPAQLAFRGGRGGGPREASEEQRGDQDGGETGAGDAVWAHGETLGRRAPEVKPWAELAPRVPIV